ncbi:MAG: hypothetical protein ACLQDM_24935 [Bradyrhizobium sp.]
MRQTKASGWMVRNSSSAAMRALRLAVVPLGIGLVMTAGAARAGDDQQDDRSITEKISDGFKNMVRGTNMDNRGIDYRERSPLVVPPTLDLPPPAASSNNVQIANWPKDPDERQRRAVIAAKKKNAPPPARVQVTTVGAAAADPAHPINIAPPPEDPPIPGTTRPAYGNDRNGTAQIDPVYDKPGDLFTGGASMISDSIGDPFGLFGDKKTGLTVTPGTEPTREALTQPPVGYQSPSPNYPYAPESKGWLSGQSNPDRNPLASRSSATSMEK